MIDDMHNGLIFDYTNPNTNYKFRDNLIYQRFVDLSAKFPNKGVLCPIGMRHTNKSSSVFKLNHLENSPLNGKVCNIRITALSGKNFPSPDLRRVNFTYPNILKTNEATLIKHTEDDPPLKVNRWFDYTIFINDGGSITPFEKVLRESY